MSPPTAPLWLPLAHVVVFLSCQNISNGGNLPVTAPVPRNATTRNGTFTDLSCHRGKINVKSVWVSRHGTDCIQTNETLRNKVSRCNRAKDCRELFVDPIQPLSCGGQSNRSDTVIAEFECIEVPRNVTTQNGTFTDLCCHRGKINVTSAWIQKTKCIRINKKLRLNVSHCNAKKDCRDLVVNTRQQILCGGPNIFSDTAIVEFECIEGPDATSKATTDMTSQSAAMTSPGVTQITVSGLTGATGDGSSGGGPEAATTDMTSQSAAMMSPGVTQSTVSGLTGATDDSGFLGVYIGAGCAVMILLAAVITSLIVYLKRRRRHRAASDQTTGTPHELRSHADHVVNAAENEYSETGPSKNSTQQVTMATAHPSETYTEVRFRRESDDPSDLVLRENAIYGQAEEYPPQHDGKPQHDGGGFSRQANNDESEAFLPRIAREGPEVPPPDLVDGMDAETLKTPADDELFMDENDMYGSS